LYRPLKVSPFIKIDTIGKIFLFYEKSPGNPRTLAPATLTGGVLGWLLEDFKVVGDEVVSA
jgi:hypothetical protein